MVFLGFCHHARPLHSLCEANVQIARWGEDHGLYYGMCSERREYISLSSAFSFRLSPWNTSKDGSILFPNSSNFRYPEMSFQDMDLEKEPMITTASFSGNSGKRGSMSALSTYQILVGDIDAPVSAGDDSLYHDIVLEERRAKYWHFVTAVLMYSAIAAQVILCLGIVIGSQIGIGKDRISILAAVNTGVAATIGVLKALGLPDKKAVERNQLQKEAQRIRTTTRKLRAGLEVDVEAEAEEVRKMYEQTEDEARLEAAGISAATSAGLQGFRKK